MILSLKKQSAVPTSSFDEPPGKQARRNPAALINNILWIISKKQDTQCKFQSVLVKKVLKDCPKNQRNIKNIQIYVNDIRELRNRVCHYEKIILQNSNVGGVAGVSPAGWVAENDEVG